MTTCLTSIAALALGAATTHAAIVDVARYHLGEAGSLSSPNNIPKDSLSTDTFAGLFINGGSVISSTLPGSTAALDLGDAPTGYYSATGNGVFGSATLGGSPDNFGVELLIMADLGQADNIFFTGTGTDLSGNNGLLFEIRSGNWAAAIPGNDWIGSILGTGQPVTAGWNSLAIIRNTGITTLYINGIAQPRTTTAQPLLNSGLHLGVTPGGGSWFRGAMDELHVFTFNPLTDNPVTFLTTVPEPSVSLALASGLLALRRRRKA
jgi:Concanavalin A-like lectin/glucanases superfamily